MSTNADETFKTELVALIPSMRAFARGLCHNVSQAEDLAQEGLAKAWAARASFTPGTNMKAWTFMIVRNLFYSEKRKSWRWTELDPQTAEQTLVSVGDPSSSLELDELRRALTMLPDDQREALILIGAGGLSYEEAAEICAVAVGTIKSRVSRARDRLALIYATGAIDADGAPASLAMASIFRQVDEYRLAAA